MNSGDSFTSSHPTFVGSGARSLIAFSSAALLFSLATATVAFARHNDGLLRGIVDERRLRAGQFQWADGASGYGPLVIVVSLSTQRARVYQGDVLIAVTSISTGKRGYETPTGTYTILQKNRFHRSNLYDNAPMPFMLRLTWGGLAIHSGRLPGRPASHGCIRVPQGFAQKLFAIAGYDTTVVVMRRDNVRSASSALRVNEMREPGVAYLDPLDRPYQASASDQANASDQPDASDRANASDQPDESDKPDTPRDLDAPYRP